MESKLVTIPLGEFLREARESLSGNWVLGVGIVLIMVIVSAVASLIPFLPLLIGGPLGIGMAKWSLNISRDNHAGVENLFEGFQNFGTAFLAYLMILVIVLFGMIALIIPGIIAAIGLSMTYYIIADDPDIGAIDALKKSWAIMDGNKMDYFLVMIRFIPWALLCVLTLFLGFFLLAPWIQVTGAKFYEHITEREDDDVLRHLTMD